MPAFKAFGKRKRNLELAEVLPSRATLTAPHQGGGCQKPALRRYSRSWLPVQLLTIRSCIIPGLIRYAWATDVGQCCATRCPQNVVPALSRGGEYYV